MVNTNSYNNAAEAAKATANTMKTFEATLRQSFADLLQFDTRIEGEELRQISIAAKALSNTANLLRDYISNVSAAHFAERKLYNEI